ncbi:MAG: hypothetical protein CM1200mP3_11810 [Chloroflexota bacterium]|nr:MAG: hypothetical protein CM1200mP3_11810 [Chloroflexota bacterium]
MPETGHVFLNNIAEGAKSWTNFERFGTYHTFVSGIYRKR